MSGTDIFLSYARHDRATARLFAESLADEGFNVWWDASLHSGETFDEVIEQRLRDARAVIVLWSPRSVASRWVRAEATQADRRNKLVPAIIEPCDRPIIFELTHAADLCDWTGEITDLRWRAFVDDLRRLVDARRDEEQPAALGRIEEVSSRPQPPSRRPLRPGNDEVISADRTRSAARSSTGRAPPDEDLPASGDFHCLEPEDAELAEGPIIIDSSGVRIGRTAPADIVLSHKSISREHCIVGLANDELLVTDLNSTNGTYIDDVRITRSTILPVGSVLRIGQICLRHAIRSSGGDADPKSALRNAGPQGGLEAGRLAAAS